MKYILLILLFSSCITKKSTRSSTPKEYYIAPYMAIKSHNDSIPNLLITATDSNDGQWFFVGDSIKAFNFKPGYTCVATLEKSDDTDHKFHLLKLISKTRYDSCNINIHDIWGVIDMEGTKPLKSGFEQTIEINLTTNTILGTSGCNNYTGAIETTTNTNKISFNNIILGINVCEHSSSERSFINALKSVDSFFRFNQDLLLISDDIVVIHCRQMD